MRDAWLENVSYLPISHDKVMRGSHMCLIYNMLCRMRDVWFENVSHLPIFHNKVANASHIQYVV